jgi:carboxymethylenebutenolidase
MQLEERDAIVEVNGGRMPVYVTHPVVDGGQLPAVVVVHEIFGLSDHIKDVARRFANEGYLAVAPDLFWNMGPVPDFSDRESFMRFRQSMDDRNLLSSLDAAVDHLRGESLVDPARIGIVGFCMGGYYALLETVRSADIAACVDFYGGPLVHKEPSENRPLAPLEAARDIKVPLLGLFGEEDQGIPVEQVHELERRVREAGVPCETVIYPGAGHAFHNDTGQRYVESAAKDAWKRTIEFFDRYLNQAQ